MIIKVPVPIPVGGHLYSIILVPELQDENRNGSINYRTQTIRINPLTSSSQIREALVHEVLHCINYVYNAGNVTESLINGLSEGLNQVLQHMEIEFDWSDIRRGKWQENT
jgi:hypothetical protein